MRDHEEYPKAFQVVAKSEQCCGHKHKTQDAATKCREKLLNFSTHRNTCSAEWYNSKIVGIGEGYNYNAGTF
jgi:hypothetical protein